ncbi:MAG: hypothetical protein H6595_12335 [Flavobacteriales bacterium]|nr:hypothetical protein [Flavobacteriales bacterium]MCB9168251.1 hypothetical protein [Flavobacteriales bacterium]
MNKTYPFIATLFVLVACDRQGPSDTTQKENEGTTTEATTANVGSDGTTSGFNSPEDEWRRPDDLLTTIGPVAGRTVGNVFAGDGYYAFQLVKAGARVIATDPDPTHIAAIEERKKALGVGDDRLEVRRTEGTGTGLRFGEVDMMFTSHPYLQLGTDKAARVAWVRSARECIKSPRMLVMVDFLPAPTPEGIGTPMDQRIVDTAVMDELGDADCSDVGSYSKKLPYQYILLALDYQGD